MKFLIDAISCAVASVQCLFAYREAIVSASVRLSSDGATASNCKPTAVFYFIFSPYSHCVVGESDRELNVVCLFCLGA